jgi:hypothetical protein
VLTLVRVPVLSEQMTLTDPRVSTVFRDLQRILFLRMRFAVIVREAVKAIGRPSGMNAIATETQSTISVGTLMKPGCFGRKYAALGKGQSGNAFGSERSHTRQ